MRKVAATLAAVGVLAGGGCAKAGEVHAPLAGGPGPVAHIEQPPGTREVCRVRQVGSRIILNEVDQAKFLQGDPSVTDIVYSALTADGTEDPTHYRQVATNVLDAAINEETWGLVATQAMRHLQVPPEHFAADTDPAAIPLGSLGLEAGVADNCLYIPTAPGGD